MLSLLLPLLLQASAQSQDLADAYLSDHNLNGTAVLTKELGHSQTANRSLYARHIDGVPIRGEVIKVLEFFDGQTMVLGVDSDYSGLQADATLSSDQALAIALNARADVKDVEPTFGKGGLPHAGIRTAEYSRLMWADRVLIYEVRMAVNGDGNWHEDVLVNATTGEIVDVNDLRLACCAIANGNGDVFIPNPSQTANNHNFNDSNDSNSAIPSSEYFNVTLQGLDGSGYLQGPHCSTSPTGGRAFSSALNFNYLRADDRFEEVVVYYAMDEFQRYLQSIGQTNANNRQQKVDVNGSSWDNSWFDTGNRQITFGYGGVDDGEDADIIIHEYGHGLHYDVQGSIGSGQNGAMSEGYGDYFAASFYDDALVGEWDAVSYTGGNVHYLRRVDGTKHFPNNLVNQVHSDGEIWSAGLWDFRMSVGPEIADNIIVEAMALQSSNTGMASAANMLLTAEQQLYGGKYAPFLHWSMSRRGFFNLPNGTFNLDPQDTSPTSGNTVRLDIDASGFGGSNFQVIVSRQPGEYLIGAPHNATINVGTDLLNASLNYAAFSGTLSGSGTATVSLQIPSGFTNQEFTFQAFILDQNNNITEVSLPCGVREGIR
ncbi:MAG: M36 family metallopeptidase [Planctomycetes bacterium]|nr:M36 family metallopeptidase [Planctomycetota bacterium]